MKTPALCFALFFLTIFFAPLKSTAQSTDAAQIMLAADSIPDFSTTEGLVPSNTLTSQWWTLFHDPCIDSLVALTDRSNLQIAGALRRIEASRLALKSTRSAYFPTIDASAGWDVMRNSGRTSRRYAETSQVSYFSAGLDMTWEIDVFGRVAAQVRAGEAELKLSRADYLGVLLSTKASMVKAYFTLLYARGEREVAEQQLASQRKILDITELRKETGLSSGLDVAQARTTVLSTLATLPAIKADEQNAINSMALLAGTFPSRIEDLLATCDSASLPELPKELPVGVPADMVSERPDILTARANIDAYAARLGIAKKDWLPTLSLTASAGTQARRLDDLFAKGSFYWEVAPRISWTVFDGLARNYNIAEARLNLEAAVDSYNETLLTAWNEVENALSQYACAREQLTARTALLAEAEKTFTLSLDLYKQGLTDFSNVQSAQVSFLEARNSILAARFNALSALITLYQSLGLSGE